ncbi:hypothetical protein DB88DRAFT_77405 [Papiliotrema laurentii]|uniref:Large ribosomal subunit protein bL33m n=1 Tax=Papiliotrema laurentii TaxID=5418 RepID=A0AAD9FN40_PAPLA|nr:hypothetical protein DB88DRAFT_77405 [Papiliotrema laurentii]
MQPSLVNFAKKGGASKDRRIIVKLMSTALTGFFYTTKRLRTSDKLSMVKFDPRAKRHVLFVEGGKLK